MNSVAGAAGAGYQGTPPSLTGAGGASFPVVRVIPLSDHSQHADVKVDGVNLLFVIPPGFAKSGEQMVIASGTHSSAVPGRKKLFAFVASVYRNGTLLGGKFHGRYNIVIRLPKIKLRDRVFQYVRRRWVLQRSFRIINGKIIVGIGTSGQIEVVGPKSSERLHFLN
jgi:hypothetical protein